METVGAKVVNGYFAAWNGNLLMIADSDFEIKFNGVCSPQLSGITDVDAMGDDLVAVGYVSNVPDVRFGGQRIDTTTWTASFLLGR
jgi:hypothetical protein